MSQKRNRDTYGKSRRPASRKPGSLTGLLLALGGAVLVLVALLALRGGKQPESQTGNEQDYISGTPQLSVDREKIDLGDVKLGQTVEASFTLTNTGDGTLRFSEQPYIRVVEGC